MTELELKDVANCNVWIEFFGLFRSVGVLNWCLFGFDGGPADGAWFEVT